MIGLLDIRELDSSAWYSWEVRNKTEQNLPFSVCQVIVKYYDYWSKHIGLKLTKTNCFVTVSFHFISPWNTGQLCVTNILKYFFPEHSYSTLSKDNVQTKKALYPNLCMYNNQFPFVFHWHKKHNFECQYCQDRMDFFFFLLIKSGSSKSWKLPYTNILFLLIYNNY